MNMLFQATESRKEVLYDVLYVPKLTCNLFSVRAAVSEGNAIEFGPQKCCIRDEYGKLHGMGSLVDKLYQLDCQLQTLRTSQLSHLKVVTYGINVLDMYTNYASRNVWRMNLYKGLTSKND